MGSKLRLGGVIVDEPGIMRDGHASRGDIDDNSAMGALAIFPATMMVADGVFGEGGQGALKRQRGAANISPIVYGVMVAQTRWQFPARKSDGTGKGVPVRCDPGGRRTLK